MGDDVKKRWSVTYTKHITQKRKVYQDGFLELHSSKNKIKLYDEYEKLLGVKIVKKDDVVSSGETLAFDAYLVDVGELVGNSNSISNLDCPVREKYVTEKSELFHAKRFKVPVFASKGDGKTNFRRNKASSSCPSPSQKFIREFKKNEMDKYAGPKNSPNATKSSNIEWQVLYTTQITQKAKKYHDGFLRLAACGSLGRQVTLYDLNRRVLDSRFLKKDEVIESGGSLVFDSHLVDIGELEGDQKPLSNLKAAGENPFVKLTHRPQIGELPKGAFSEIEVKSTSNLSVTSSEPGKIYPVDKPLRGAAAILSSFRKSTTEQSSVSTNNSSLEQCPCSQSSDYVHSQFQNHTKTHREDSIHEKDGAGSHTMVVVKSENSEILAESKLKCSTASSVLVGEDLSDISVPYFGGLWTDKSILETVSFMEEPQVTQEPQVPPLLGNGSNEDTEYISKSGSSRAATGCLSNLLPKELNTQTFTQRDADIKLMARPSDGENKLDITRLSFEVCNNTGKMGDVPSFDLGF